MEELLISLSDAREMVGQSRFEDAAELYASALRTSQRAFGEDHAKTRDILVHLANARAALGQNEEAQELLERALQMIAGGDTVGDGSSEASPSLIQVAFCFVLFCWGVFIYCLPVPYIHYLFSTYDRLSNR